ncbi:MAG: ATP-binding protein [Acidobacteria bacterium]|nr:ATP-binding protein [Acidobacteriota bacterium]
MVKRVLTQVRWVSTNPSKGGAEIRVWPIDANTQRIDLTVPLDKSGSGIGQVLGMLYVVMNTDRSSVILIDEPQSFLHPGAVRKLLEILRGYPRHQFIIATHSPTVITSSNPQTITMIRLQDCESVLEPIDSNDAKQLQVYLAEVGARLADVFGADNVLWVEGKTEEISLPIILEKIAQKPLMGTSILGLRSTGELKGKDAERIVDIYNRLSRSGTLIPPAIGFCLDRECLTPQERDALNRRCNNQIVFTNRRMYENYLLNPKAICSVVNGIEGFRSPPITEEEVKKFFEDSLKDNKYFSPFAYDGNSENWVNDVNGAKLLSALFAQLSETRVRYEKIEHSIALTERIVENSPEDLREIADQLVRILESGVQQNG